MDEINFEGTLILEKLAEINKVEEFFDAVDSDDFARAQKLMRAAQIDQQTIDHALRMMQESSDHG